MSETAYKEGDTVRVTTVGEVMALEPNYLPIRVADGGSSWIPKSHIESVEVIRSPLKVGDVLPGGEVRTAKWADGSLICSEDSIDFVLCRIQGGWISVSTGIQVYPADNYKVVHLPDSA